MVANYIAWTSAGITLIFFVAGFIVYTTVRGRAIDEATEAARKWLDDHGADLRREAETRNEALKQEVASLLAAAGVAAREIAELKAGVAVDAASARQVFEASKALFAPGAGLSSAALSGAARDAVGAIESASEELKQKPEADFTAADYLARGLALVAKGQAESALAAFDTGLAIAVRDASLRDRDHAALLFARAGTLARLGRAPAALAAYDELDKRFGRNLNLCEQVARSMVNRGALLGRSGLTEDGIRVFDEVVARYDNDRAPDLREHVAVALLNKAMLIGQSHSIEASHEIHEKLVERIGGESDPPLSYMAARALNGRGFDSLLLAKQRWNDASERKRLLTAALVDFERALKHCKPENLAMIHGNRGYASFLADDRDTAASVTRQCLSSGGEHARKIQHADASRYRIEPEDTQYDAMLESVWLELHPDIGELKGG